MSHPLRCGQAPRNSRQRTALRAAAHAGRSTVIVLACILAVTLTRQLRAAAVSTDDATADPAAVEFFERRIRPVLIAECYECHSASSPKLEGRLALDTRVGLRRGGASGPVIVVGSPDESPLIRALRHDGLEMPPTKRLSDAVVADFAQWIRTGAVDTRADTAESDSGEKAGWAEVLAERRRAWFWKPVRRPEIPQPASFASIPATDQNDARDTNPIDAFLQAAREREELPSAPRADLQTLVRRVSFVLTGLPPAPEDLAAGSAGSAGETFPATVDRLLNSPQFGEHWARHWMDLVRYSDTHGSEHDPVIPYAWQYRDYLVRAFNADLPYDAFIREHLAGDLLPPRWNAALSINEAPLGTGFLRFVEFYPTPIDVKNEEGQIVESQIDMFGKAFLGLTIACARCHDHKFDAISARDYQALYGVLSSSRVTMLRLDDPARIHQHDAALADLKSKIREALATVWLRQTEHWPTAIPTAIRLRESETASGGAPAETATRSAPVAGTAAAAVTFPADEVSLAAETARWQRVLQTSLQNDAAPLSPLFRQIAASRPSDAESDSPDAVAEDARFGDEHRQLVAGRMSEFRNRFRRFVDFSDHSTAFEPWFPQDNFQATSPPGDFVVSLNGPQVATVIYPQGRYSHLLSDRHGGTFRSSNFNLTMKFISVLVCGTNNARVRLVIENFQGDQVLFTSVMPPLTNPQLHWLTLPIREVWTGRRAYLELAPRDEMPYPGKRADILSLQTDGRSGAGLRMVVFHDAPGVPETEPAMPEQIWQPTLEEPTLPAALIRTVRSALEHWREHRCSDQEAILLNELLQAGILMNHSESSSNSSAGGEELVRFVQRYRETEFAVPVPMRATGFADETGFDERFFPRGDHRSATTPVPRRFLEVLGSRDLVIPGHPSGATGRLALAEALADPENPLVSRVMVNRLWQHVFGVGLVATPDNFGRMGDAPSHPELLDWLAAEFMSSGWSVKHMLRLMLTSQTFQSSAAASEASHQRDPDNRLLSHASIRRLEAESIRDSLLSVSGRLDPAMGGPGVPLPLPGVYRDFENHVDGPPDGHGRRSLYLEARRNYPQPLLTVFDQPKPVLTVGRRNVTNVPAQSLALLNNAFVKQQAQLLAERTSVFRDPERRVAALYQLAFARPAAQQEIAQALAFLTTQAAARKSAASGGVAASEPPDAADPVWADLAHALVNMKEFLYFH